MKDSRQCILIADDEKEIRDVLTLLLTAEGYAVLAAEDGQQALELSSESVDLYILDIGMPGLSGIETASRLRQRFGAPIVFLTAYSGESDKVMGFSVGADDYMVKPFSNMELVMRIRAILRRSTPGRNRLNVGDLVLDLDRQTVSREGQTIPLTYTEYQILELLAKHRKKIYSLENIYASIWGDDAVGDGAIMAHIKNIRKKLGDNSREPRYIRTAWGRGYYIE